MTTETVPVGPAVPPGCVPFSQSDLLAAFDALAVELPTEADQRAQALGLPPHLSPLRADVLVMLTAMRTALLRWHPSPNFLEPGEAQKVLDTMTDAVWEGLGRVLALYESAEAQARGLMGTRLRGWNTDRPVRRERPVVFKDEPPVDTTHIEWQRDEGGRLRPHYRVRQAPEDIRNEKHDEQVRHERRERQRRAAEAEAEAERNTP